MERDERIELVRHWFEDVLSGPVVSRRRATLNGADDDEIDLSRLFSPDFENYVVPCPPGGWKRGVEGAWQIVRAFRRSMPNLLVEVDEQFVAGDRVVTRYTASGAVTGRAFLGQQADGGEYKVTGVSIDQVVGGRIVATWGTWDAFGLMVQMGLLPPMTHLDA